MSPDSPPDLRAAFLAATYGTRHGRFRLGTRPGPAPAWAVGPWAIITAWNPGGRPTGAGANARAAAALLVRVQEAGHTPQPAENGEGEWREDALLVPGAHLGEAAAWGAEFGQAAVLWGTGARVALVWPGPGGSVRWVERFWTRLI